MIDFWGSIYFFSLFVLFSREAYMIYLDYMYDEVEIDIPSLCLYFVPFLNTLAALVALLNFSFWIFDND